MLKTVFLVLALAGYSITADAQNAMTVCGSLAYQSGQARQTVLSSDDVRDEYATELDREGHHAEAQAHHADVASDRQRWSGAGSGADYERCVYDACMATGGAFAGNFAKCVGQ